MLLCFTMNELNKTNAIKTQSSTSKPTTCDQSTQASFPVLLRSQQKALKRYATLSEIKNFPPKYPTSAHTPWITNSSGMHGYVNNGFHSLNNVNNNNILRPKSLNLNVDSLGLGGRSQRASTMNLTTIDGQNSSRHKLSTLNLAQPPDHINYNQNTISRSRVSTLSCNTLSPKQIQGGEALVSYAGSDVSFNERHSTGDSLLYSGNFKAAQQNKWRIGPDHPDNLSISKTMCSCHENQAKALRQTNTPEGLSWRRLHMSRAKLKATATTSELLSGFAMVAMVELQINEPTTVPEWLFVLFAVCTTILVAVHIFALMISTYILPNIDAISKLDVCELVSESPHERMRGFIELAWAFSTVLGLFLFLVEIAILCWVKFWDYSFTAAIAATVIVIPVLVLFVAFAVHFYHSLVVYKCDTSDVNIQQLEDMKKELDLATSPV